MADAHSTSSGQGPDSSGLQILITQRALKNFGGTELYTVELSRNMIARGHKVTIYTPRPGEIEKLAIPTGAKIVDRIEDVPVTPDIIHGHHHLALMPAIARFPNTPAIHVWHGVRPWAESVPVHPSISKYVITSERMRASITAHFGIEPDLVTLIPNYVDTNRFSHVRKVADRPQKALLFGQSGFSTDELDMLEQACADNNLILDKIGGAYGNPRPRPEYFLPDYDLVFAVGRSAIEAMAVGCAVFPIVPQLAGHRVRSNTLDDWAEINFSPRYYHSATRFDSEWLSSELTDWDPEDIARVTERARADLSMQKAFDQFEALYHEAISQGVTPGTAEDMSIYLNWLAGSADDVWAESIRNASENAAMKDAVKELEAAKRSQDIQIQFLTRLLKQRLTDKITVPRPTRPVAELKAQILRSGLFDASWYLEVNPDVAAAGMDPLDHYLSNGASEGRDPSPDFDTTAFWQANPDLRGQGATPLEHVVDQMFGTEQDPR